MTDGGNKPRAGGDSATRAAKAFLGVASIAGTLGGWAALAAEEPAPAAPAPIAQRPQSVTPTAAAPSVTTKPEPARITRVERTRRAPITLTRSSR